MFNHNETITLLINTMIALMEHGCACISAHWDPLICVIALIMLVLIVSLAAFQQEFYHESMSLLSQAFFKLMLGGADWRICIMVTAELVLKLIKLYIKTLLNDRTVSKQSRLRHKKICQSSDDDNNS